MQISTAYSQEITQKIRNPQTIADGLEAAPVPFKPCAFVSFPQGLKTQLYLRNLSKFCIDVGSAAGKSRRAQARLPASIQSEPEMCHK